MPPRKLTDVERKILAQLEGKINYGQSGRPTNHRKSLIAQLAAVTALMELKKQSKDAKNGN